jgi:hypothetical protein
MKRNLIRMTCCAVLLMAWIFPALAITRASLDRDQVALGESVTLSIESDQANAVPDLSPLMVDFVLEGQSTSRSVQWVNGKAQQKSTYAITLSPKREGILAVPPVQVGGEKTGPLTLQVSAGAAPTETGADSGVYLETEVDDANPYVQQSVGVRVRLIYRLPIAEGQFGLDAPDGASLQAVGDISYSSREIDGKTHKVAERRYVLVPERSGVLTVPGARFQGRIAGNWMDDFLGNGGQELRTSGPVKKIEVRAQPVGAPQPWLPLRDLRMRYLGAPQSLRAGEAAELVVEVMAEGATQAQMPELPTPSIAGAQVFAEPAHYDETFNNGSPRVKLTRRYSIVPNGAGRLAVPGMKLAWWDVRTGSARTASLPDLDLEVAKGSGNFSTSALPGPARNPAAADEGVDARVVADGMRIPVRAWVWMAVAFAGLWLLTLTLAWALWRRRNAVEQHRVVDPRAGASVASHTHTLADLKRALDAGSLDDVGDVLRGMCTPPAADLDALLSRLDSAAQRDAVEQLRRARWADGDGTRARSVLRDAFRNGPTWRAATTHAKDVLPPLYPRR